MNDPLKRLIEEREAKARELYKNATPTVQNVGVHTSQRTVRRYLVEIYEENTEFADCMYLLADIAKWFGVQPYQQTEGEVGGGNAQDTLS